MPIQPTNRDRSNAENRWIEKIKTKQIVEGWCDFVESRIVAGWTPYLLTFQFRQIGGSRRRMIEEMTKEVERVYATLLTRVVRRPTSFDDAQGLPVWIICPDLPVWKREKQLVQDVTVNDGLHFQGVALMPRKSRLAQPLDEHFEENVALYVRAPYPLIRAHAKLIVQEPTRATDYIFKAYKNGSVAHDDLLILPRALSEVKGR